MDPVRRWLKKLLGLKLGGTRFFDAVAGLFSPRQENVIWNTLLRATGRKYVRDGYVAGLLLLFLFFAVVVREYEMFSLLAWVPAIALIGAIANATQFIKNLRTTNRGADYLVLPVPSRLYAQAFLRFFFLSATLLLIIVVLTLAGYMFSMRSEMFFDELLDHFIHPGGLVALVLLSFYWLSYWCQLGRGGMLVLGYAFVGGYVAFLIYSIMEPGVWKHYVPIHLTLAAAMFASGTAMFIHYRRHFVQRASAMLFP